MYYAVIAGIVGAGITGFLSILFKLQVFYGPFGFTISGSTLFDLLKDDEIAMENYVHGVAFPVHVAYYRVKQIY